MIKKLFPLLLILLLALALRSYRLTEIPPGLTHDEANHGREAIEILDGVLRYYFPLNYGSEPLYSYTVAGAMAVLGENLFALRFVNVIFGLAALAAAFVWTRQAFDKRVALVTAVLMAVSFWPLASSREALRAGMLPFFMTLAVWFFWQIVAPQAADNPPAGRRGVWLVLGFALSIVATLHIYLAARVAWLVFPTFLIYLALLHRQKFKQSWKPVLLGLLLAGLLTIPMFVFLANNPASQTRLSMLSAPLEQIRTGQIVPILQNMAEALLAFVWPGFGDRFLAYNIPGRPVFDGITAVFFLLGLGVSIWRWKRPSYAFVLLWFLVGMLPSLVTGSTANTTRNLAALPAVYILPAVGFMACAGWIVNRWRLPERATLIGLAAVWLLIAGLITARDYFVRWGESPEVRSAYQHTLAEELAYLRALETAGNPVVMSSVYPGPAHDASIALLLAGADSRQMRWTDARLALILPPGAGIQSMIPASTPPHPAFAPYLQPLETVAMRPDDLDNAFTLYQLDAASLLQDTAVESAATFANAVELVSSKWLSPTPAPGDTAELLTIWRVVDPQKVGPLHPPAFAREAALFTHILDTDGAILAQRDGLDAPAWSWQAGDLILQIHPIALPPEIKPGEYETAVGVYDPLTGARLPVLDAAGNEKDTRFFVSPLRVAQPAS